MSRLLFAAARGARVQRHQEAINSSRTWWDDVPIQWGLDDELRIHPDDEHLQYGPVSSALRKAATAGNAWNLSSAYGHMARTYIDFHSEYPWLPTEERHRSLYLLLLAEALADEGL